MAAATLDIRMEEIGCGGTDVKPTQIALVFDAGGLRRRHCVDKPATVGWEVNARQSTGRYTTIN